MKSPFEVLIDYTNQDGELRRGRHVVPNKIAFEEGRWVMHVFDVETDSWRRIAIKDIRAWNDPVRARGQTPPPQRG